MHRKHRYTLSLVAGLAAAGFAATPGAVAEGGPSTGDWYGAGVTTLPSSQLPASIHVGPRAAGPASTAAPRGHTHPLVAPEVARLRLKNFVTQAYARAPKSTAGGDEQLPLAQVLAEIDALTPTQVHEIDARLGPVIWASRALAARSAEPGESSGLAPAQLSNPEALRSDLLAYLARVEPYAAMANGNAIVYSRLVVEMRQSIQGMSEEELLSLLDMFAVVPSAQAVLRLDPGEILGSPPPGGSVPGTANGPSGVEPHGLQAGSIHTNSACADMAFGPVATAVLTNIANTANDIAGLLSDDYMATTFNIKEIPQLIAKGIALPLQLLALAAETETSYFVNCNEGAHQVVFTEHDAEMTDRTTAISSLLDDSSKHSDLKRILSNRMDRIDTFNTEFRTLTLRLAIEKDLLRHGNPRIALFQVPASACVTVGEHQSCGLLDTVRSIVAATILDNRSAGFNTTLASVALQDGDDQRALGLYKAAYTRYRYAYQLAVRSTN